VNDSLKKWPVVRLFGCSGCHRLATTQASHWCGGEWKASFDTVIRYVADREKRVR
jgi:hypothetical protein